MRNRTMVNIYDRVGSWLVVTHGFSFHFQLNPDPITIGLRRRDDLDGRNVSHPSQSPEDVYENFLFQFSMKGVVDMLPLTAPAHTKIRAGGVYSPGSWFEDLPQSPN